MNNPIELNLVMDCSFFKLSNERKVNGTSFHTITIPSEVALDRSSI